MTTKLTPIRKLAASALSVPLIYKAENHQTAWKKGYIGLELKIIINNLNKN